MDYIQVSITCLEEYREILIAELAAVGFDSFLETDSGLEAYVPQDLFARASFDEVIATYREPAALTVVEGILPKVNWNEEWEKNYDPIEVDQLVYVRASFHAPQPGFRYEIVINPKMSFGPLVCGMYALHIERLRITRLIISVREGEWQTQIQNIHGNISIKVPGKWISTRIESLRIVKNGIQL